MRSIRLLQTIVRIGNWAMLGLFSLCLSIPHTAVRIPAMSLSHSEIMSLAVPT
jgi:hypothetical protein